jgi:hypothetical protein
LLHRFTDEVFIKASTIEEVEFRRSDRWDPLKREAACQALYASLPDCLAYLPAPLNGVYPPWSQFKRLGAVQRLLDDSTLYLYVYGDGYVEDEADAEVRTNLIRGLHQVWVDEGMKTLSGVTGKSVAELEDSKWERVYLCEDESGRSRRPRVLDLYAALMHKHTQGDSDDLGASSDEREIGDGKGCRQLECLRIDRHSIETWFELSSLFPSPSADYTKDATSLPTYKMGTKLVQCLAGRCADSLIAFELSLNSI